LPTYAAITTFSYLGRALAMVLTIAGLSSFIGVRKVLQIDPFHNISGLACSQETVIARRTLQDERGKRRTRARERNTLEPGAVRLTIFKKWNILL
jgi:hypothetical protein